MKLVITNLNPNSTIKHKQILDRFSAKAKEIITFLTPFERDRLKDTGRVEIKQDSGKIIYTIED